MIFDFFLSIIAYLFAGVASILPTYIVFPPTLAAQIGTFMAYINGWAWIFPVGTLLLVFSVVVIVVFVEFTYFTAMYVLQLIHSTLRG